MLRYGISIFFLKIRDNNYEKNNAKNNTINNNTNYTNVTNFYFLLSNETNGTNDSDIKYDDKTLFLSICIIVIINLFISLYFIILFNSILSPYYLPIFKYI